MNIDRETPICGVKPVLLKALVRHDCFDTLKAMLLLGVPEPRISTTLRDLVEAGWISWGGELDGIDQWQPTSLGRRLAASPLIRRFPISQGRALLPKVTQTARTLNANPNASHRITAIFLFGSLLTGNDDGDAGDIDLVVRVSRRKLPEEQLTRLIEAERKIMPPHLDFFQRLHRQVHDLERAIKQVSSKISLHDFSDIEAFSAPYRQLYLYDVETEAEIVPDPEVRVTKRAEKCAPRASRAAPPPLKIKAWPMPPNAPAMLEPTSMAQLYRGQHLWVKGVNPSEIANRVRLPVGTLTAYLASRREVRQAKQLQFDANFHWMIDQALAQTDDQAVSVKIVKRPGMNVLIECKAFNFDTLEGLASIRKFGNSDIWLAGRCDFLPMLESVAEAAAFWWEKMCDRFVGLDVELLAMSVSAQDRVEPMGTRRPDFRPLVKSMRHLLGRLPRRSREPEAWRHSLEYVREIGCEQLFHRVSDLERASPISTRLTKRNHPAAWRQIKAVIEPQADFMRGFGKFTFGVGAR